MNTPAVPGRARPPSRRPAILALLSIAVIGLVTAIIAGLNGGTTANTFAFEIAKTGLQLIAVAGVGSVATIAVQSFLASVRAAEEAQRREAEKAEAAQREASEHAEKTLRMQEERRQREVDRLTDARLRRDDLVRSTLQTTVRTYNNVKSIRRRFRAATGLGPDAVVHAHTYDRFLESLIDEQLQFEELKRLSPSLGRLDLTENFDEMEKYLGLVIEEYETLRARARSSSESFGMSELPRLRDLLSQDTFYDAVSTPLTRVVTALQLELLSPVEVPDPATA